MITGIETLCYVALIPHGDHYDARLVRPEEEVTVHLPRMVDTPRLTVLNEKLDFVLTGEIREEDLPYNQGPLHYTQLGSTVTQLRVPFDGRIQGEVDENHLLVITDFGLPSRSDYYVTVWDLKTGQVASIAHFDSFQQILVAAQSGRLSPSKLPRSFLNRRFGQREGWETRWQSRDYESATVLTTTHTISVGGTGLVQLPANMVTRILTGNRSFAAVSVSDQSVDNSYSYYRFGHPVPDIMPDANLVSTYIIDLETEAVAAYLPRTLAVYFPDPYIISEWARKYFGQSAGGRRVR